MKALTIRKHGGLDALEIRDVPDLVPAEGQVRVQVKAAGLNFAEVLARKGLYPDAPKPPCVVGYEGAGVVDALGAGVEAPVLGARVLFLSRFGAHAEQVCLPAEQTLPMPDAMSFEQAAALPVNYVTAFHMLFRVGVLRPQKHVFVHMAAGGVGTAVLQLCKTVPDVITYGSVSAAKHDYARSQGCTHPIDYRTLDYAEEVRRLTNGRGVDMLLDPLGGADWKKGYELLAPAGILIAFGFSNAATRGPKRSLLYALSQLARIPRFSPMDMMDKNRAVAGVNLGHLWSERELLRDELVSLLELYEQGAIRPHVHATVPFSQAAEAHQMLELGKNQGKVVLVPG